MYKATVCCFIHTPLYYNITMMKRRLTMNDYAINVLYMDMIHELKVQNNEELEQTVNQIKEMIPNEKYYVFEPYINELIGESEKQGFSRAIKYYCI